jgi:3-oxoacyl-[acyl-carrier-protein] synthase-3
MGSVIAGTGVFVPDRVVSNDDLARLMDTSDDWIARRTGVRERRIARDGDSTADLATRAARRAIEDAALDPSDIDALIVATMTPDAYAPGSAPLVQHHLGLGPVATYDVRQQCSGFLYAADLADGLIRSGKAGRVLLVGAEVHTMFQPWAEQITPLLDSGIEPTAEEFEYNTRFRDWSVLFGDGAGAFVMSEGSDDDGWQAAVLRTDGALFDLIAVPAIGSRSRPYLGPDDLLKESHMPVMNGASLFRNAVRLMPEAVEELLADTGVAAGEISLVIAHQANGRIIDAVARSLGLGEDRVPKNLDRYGNTTAASLPLLYDEMRRTGRVSPGDVVCFVAFGAGAHWGAGLYRVPAR